MRDLPCPNSIKIKSILFSAVNLHLLHGYEERGRIPIKFARDLCLFKVGNQIYGAGMNDEGSRNLTNTKKKTTILSIFIRKVLTIKGFKK